jgi:3',5'-cyclic AMP phosphodiesterase CpdA
VGAQLITELLKYPARCRAINFQEQVQALSEFYAELFTHTLQPIKNSHFPFVKEVGSYAIFGLNSNDQYSFLRNPVGSIGYLGKQQNHWLQRLFALYKAQEWRRIVVMHHHLQRRLPQNDMPVWIQKLEQLSLKIRNRRQVESLFRQADINLLLHGHTHFSMEYSQGGVRCLNAGATCESDAAGDYLKINTIDDSSGELLVEIRSLPFLLPQPNGAMLERLQPIFAN